MLRLICREIDHSPVQHGVAPLPHESLKTFDLNGNESLMAAEAWLRAPAAWCERRIVGIELRGADRKRTIVCCSCGAPLREGSSVDSGVWGKADVALRGPGGETVCDPCTSAFYAEARW